MKINKRLNTLTYQEYSNLLSQHQKYTDFNTLGLFRSITENKKLDLEQKTAIRDQAVAAFRKIFEFLQLKDPVTYFELTTLGRELTVADINQAWVDIRLNQQKILQNKRIRHRNFGTYSKHICGYETCHLNGLMIRQGSTLRHGGIMHFEPDKRGAYCAQVKAKTRKTERKSGQRLIADRLADE